MPPFNPVTEPILQELTTVTGPDHISTAEAERRLRAKDMSHHPAQLSEVVIWPTSTAQVSELLRIANRHHIPVTPWGAGSSLEGNPIPLFGGISLSMERMNKIETIHENDFQVTVQPGLGYKDLNHKLSRYGLFFAPDPGANASIGGMLANNAAGSRTVKYGATKDNVLAMEVVLADGRIIQVGSRSIKQSSAYDLLHLFIGSEGTLGVTTRATLSLMPVPTVMSSALATFPTIEQAVEAVVAVRGSGLDVAALEFIDGRSAALLSREEGVAWGDHPVLLMEVHATHETAADLDLAIIQQICAELGALHFQATRDHSERKKMWTVRHHMFETKRRVFPHYRWQLMDIAVPISAYPALIAYVYQSMREFEVAGYAFGHAGDGNLHVELPYTDDEGKMRSVAANDQIVYKAIELGGTSTGEHGVGIGKMKFMEREHGTAVEVMRSLKTTLDPNGILNPGKILP